MSAKKPKRRKIISYEPGKCAPLINRALKGKRGQLGAIKSLIDECVIGYLGPKYPKVMLKCEVERPASAVARGARAA